ncbi:MAG: hypothetical protein ACI8RD_004058, partial [Bacillariaceae sp.]|jgi:hypothetical protein
VCVCEAINHITRYRVFMCVCAIYHINTTMQEINIRNRFFT